MKLISKHFEKNHNGSVTLCPQEPSDMWHLFNLIRNGDIIKSKTIRKVVNESSTGSVSSNRVQLTLCVKVHKIDFDAESCELHLNGQVIEENSYVKLGSYHTIDLELNRNVSITKENWDTIDLDVIEEACDPGSKAEIGAIVLQEGLCNVCLVTEHMTILKQRIDTPIPRKRLGSSTEYQKGLQRFYSSIWNAMERSFDYNKLKVIVIASPGFIGEDLLKYVNNKAVKEDDKIILHSKNKFLVVHSSSGHIFALKEALSSPEVCSQLADTKFAREVNILDKFFKMMHIDENKAWYGYKHVSYAVENSAVNSLLISDSLFRSNNISERKKYVSLVEKARECGAEVFVFSSLHESGKQLDYITGVAAILNFPLSEMEDMDDTD